jgi:CHAT domain-containing protein
MDANIAPLAERLTDDRTAEASKAEVASLEPDARLQLAWALKDLCIATWTSAPTRARVGAEALEQLFAIDSRAEIGALRDWAKTVAHLAVGEMEAAVTAGKRAAEHFNAADQPLNAAKIDVACVMALAQLGRVAEAEQIARRAREAFIAARDHGYAGKVELNLGSMLLQQDRYEEAIELYKHATVHFARAGDIEYSITTDIAMSNALSDIGEFDEAFRICGRSINRAEQAHLSDTKAYAFQSLGLLEGLRGNPTAALRAYEKARALYEEIGDKKVLAECERDVADVYLQIGLYPESRETYARLLQNLEQHGSRVELAWALANLASAQFRSDLRGVALHTTHQSEKLFRELDKPFGIVTALLLRAEIALAGDELEIADRALSEANVECARFQSPAAQAVLQELAIKLHLRRNRLDAAKQALSALGALVSESGNRVYELSRLNGLASVAEAEGDPALARALYAQAIECFQTLHTALPSSEMKIGFRAKAKYAFDRLVVLSAANGEAAPLMAAMERGRADYQTESGDAIEASNDATTPRIRVLRARLNKAYRLASRPEDDDAHEGSDAVPDVREMENELLELTRRQRLLSTPLTSDAVAPMIVNPPLNEAYKKNNSVSNATTNSANQSFENRIKRDGLFVDSKNEDDLQRLQSALAADDVLVAFYRVDNHVYACVVTRDIAKTHVIAAPELDRYVTQARSQIETLRGAHTHLHQHADTLLRRADHYLAALGDQLFGPLIDVLASARRLLLVPHAILHYIPFAALRVQSVPLVDRFDVVTLPAVSAMLGTASGNTKTDEMVRIAPQSNALLVGSTQGHLAHVAEEVRALSALIPGSRSLVDDEATLERVQTAMPVAEYIHLACHGQFRADSPYFSALHFADGALTVRDISEMKLNARLVTLSACETGLSQLSPGDELLGLTRALMHAGAERVLTSLWAVDDAATATLMREFYRRLMQGMSASRALRESQRELRDGNPAWRHPYFWAAFTLAGRP